MDEVRELVAAFHTLNGNRDTSIGRYTPALIGMFGSTKMFDVFLASIDEALENGEISGTLRERAANLARTFIPQVAGMNGITDPAAQEVTAAELGAIRSDSPQNRSQGVRLILGALMKILTAVQRIP